ncbi:MAG TPA: flagellar motor protein MotB [Bacillota bacterium]|nr:flagellar motor protein MotB [Bacillota bacterium]
MRKKKQRKDNKIDESWLLPYSDMLTLLVALFIVLFAMSEIDAQKYKELARIFKTEFSSDQPIAVNDGGSGGEDIPVQTDQDDEAERDDTEDESMQELADLRELQAAFNEYIQANHLTEMLETQLTDEGLLITILNDITFDSASAVVKSEGRKVAQEVSQLLDTDPPRQVVISGHADDQPINNATFSSNWELSAMRAVNFMRLVLENNDDLDPTYFSAKGFGEFQPIVPNTSEKNRAKNRRVEVLVMPNTDIEIDE